LHFYINSFLSFAVIVAVMAMVEILVLLLDAEKHVLEPFSPDFRMRV
jgi:hypothetical protein